MKIIYAGTPAFALPTLQALHTAGHEVAVVYTQPDRPAGRGRKLRPSPVKQYALMHDLPVRQPRKLQGAEQDLRRLEPDVMVVVAYGLLLPPSLLGVPRYGCINVHASLLPRWRGAAPIARALQAGDPETGVTIMRMEAGLDTGPMLLQTRLPIRESDTTAVLEERLAHLGAQALCSALAQLAQGILTAHPQDHTQACYAPKLQKGEAPIDWSQPALLLHRKIRAFNPWPVATSTWRGETLRLWEPGPLHTPVPAAGEPGTVIAADGTGIYVQTGDGVLCITRLQAAGGRALPAGEFLNGVKLRPGERLGA